MKAFAVWWTVGFLLATAMFGHGLVGVLVGIGTWFLTVQIWWRTPCRRCEGSPRYFDWATTDNWRPCPACSGRGWVPRLFAVGRE
ncbi:MAG: hypothetical protein ACRDQ0_17705 [Pseudonocardia sp.]